MFCLRPVKKLSRHKISWPSLIRRSHKCEPRKPAPPVTRIRIILPSAWPQPFVGGKRKIDLKSPDRTSQNQPAEIAFLFIWQTCSSARDRWHLSFPNAPALGRRIRCDHLSSLRKVLRVQVRQVRLEATPLRPSTRSSEDPLCRSRVPFRSGTFLSSITVAVMVKVVGRVSP